jgi:IclR family pca regulon transcriptional regulator
VRAQGWALNNQELDLGARSIAAPVVDKRTGEYISAVNVTVSTSRVSVEELIETCLQPLLEATAQISSDIALMGTHR